MFIKLTGLVQARALPLSLALQLFVSKVDSLLSHGRWLDAVIPGSQDLLDEVYEK